MAGSLDARVEQAVSAQEPAFVARYAFELAQAFNGVLPQASHFVGGRRSEAVIPADANNVRARPTGRGARLMGIVAPEKM